MRQEIAPGRRRRVCRRRRVEDGGRVGVEGGTRSALRSCDVGSTGGVYWLTANLQYWGMSHRASDASCDIFMMLKCCWAWIPLAFVCIMRGCTYVYMRMRDPCGIVGAYRRVCDKAKFYKSLPSKNWFQLKKIFSELYRKRLKLRYPDLKTTKNIYIIHPRKRQTFQN